MRGSPLGTPRLSGGLHPPHGRACPAPTPGGLLPVALSVAGGRRTRLSWRACPLRPSGRGHSRGSWRGQGRAPELLLGVRRASRGAVLCAGGLGPNPRPRSREGARGVSPRAERGRGHPTPGLQPRRERQGRATQSIKTISLLFKGRSALTSGWPSPGRRDGGRRGAGTGSTWHQAPSTRPLSPRPGCGSLGARQRPPALLQQLFQVLGPLHCRLQRRPRLGLGRPPPAPPQARPRGPTWCCFRRPSTASSFFARAAFTLQGSIQWALGQLPPGPVAGRRLRAAGGPGGASIPEELAGGCARPPHPTLLTAGTGPSVRVGDWW